MKNIFLIYATLVFWISYSQEKDNKIYDDAITLIKKTQKFKEYLSDNKSLNDNFKDSKKMYSFCELYIFFKEETNFNINNYCENEDWINDTVIKNCDLKKKSDRGEKSFNLRFTNTIESYFIAEIKSRSKTNNTLIYLFKIKDGSVVLIDFDNIFYD